MEKGPFTIELPGGDADALPYTDVFNAPPASEPIECDECDGVREGVRDLGGGAGGELVPSCAPRTAPAKVPRGIQKPSTLCDRGGIMLGCVWTDQCAWRGVWSYEARGGYGSTLDANCAVGARVPYRTPSPGADAAVRGGCGALRCGEYMSRSVRRWASLGPAAYVFVYALWSICVYPRLFGPWCTGAPPCGEDPAIAAGKRKLGKNTVLVLRPTRPMWRCSR